MLISTRGDVTDGAYEGGYVGLGPTRQCSGKALIGLSPHGGALAGQPVQLAHATAALVRTYLLSQPPWGSMSGTHPVAAAVLPTCKAQEALSCIAVARQLQDAAQL